MEPNLVPDGGYDPPFFDYQSKVLASELIGYYLANLLDFNSDDNSCSNEKGLLSSGLS